MNRGVFKEKKYTSKSRGDGGGQMKGVSVVAWMLPEETRTLKRGAKILTWPGLVQFG